VPRKLWFMSLCELRSPRAKMSEPVSACVNVRPCSACHMAENGPVHVHRLALYYFRKQRRTCDRDNGLLPEDLRNCTQIKLLKKSNRLDSKESMDGDRDIERVSPD